MKRLFGASGFLVFAVAAFVSTSPLSSASAEEAFFVIGYCNKACLEEHGKCDRRCNRQEDGRDRVLCRQTCDWEVEQCLVLCKQPPPPGSISEASEPKERIPLIEAEQSYLGRDESDQTLIGWMRGKP